MKILLYKFILLTLVFAPLSITAFVFGGSVKYTIQKDIISLFMNAASFLLAISSIWLGFCEPDILKKLFGSTSLDEKQVIYRDVRHLILPILFSIIMICLCSSYILFVPLIINYFQFSSIFKTILQSISAVFLFILWLCLIIAYLIPLHNISSILFSANKDIFLLKKKAAKFGNIKRAPKEKKG